jgi:CHAD domain-containing protein
MSKPKIIRGINPDSPLSGALDKILKARVSELLSYAPGARKGIPVKVHDMRVACRRLLSVLKIFRGAVKVKYTSRLKKVFRALQGVRECDVFTGVLKKYVEENGSTAAAASLAAEYVKMRRSAEAALARSLAGFGPGVFR